MKTAFITGLVAVLLAGGVAWACVPTITPVDCYEDQCITPTPTEEVTPTVPPAEHGDNQSDGRNDGLGCASHDCNTQKVVVPSAPPETGTGVDNRSGQDLQPATAWK